MPVGETVEPAPMPSGEVAPMVGVGLAIPLVCALAPLQTISAARIAAIHDNLIGSLPLKPALSRRELTGDPEPALPNGLGQSRRRKCPAARACTIKHAFIVASNRRALL
jgi:hypothetical protein